MWSGYTNHNYKDAASSILGMTFVSCVFYEKKKQNWVFDITQYLIKLSILDTWYYLLKTVLTFSVTSIVVRIVCVYVIKIQTDVFTKF